MKSRALRVAVIGRQGQIATALRLRLPLAGIKVITLARPEIDLLKAETLAVAIRRARPDVVINPAAFTEVDRAEDKPDTAFAVNAIGAGVVAAAAAAIDCPVIHFSTDYVFDGRSTGPYVENDERAPLGIYGASKLAGERAVAAASERHVILRTAWVCSPWGKNFVKTVLRLGAERDVLRVVNDQRGVPTFAVDIADAVAVITSRLTSGQTDRVLFGTFHLASSGETTWCGLARAIMARAAARGAKTASVEGITTAEYPTRSRRPRYSKLATDKIERTYGIRLPAWQDSLDDCLDILMGTNKSGCNADAAPQGGVL